MSNIRIIPVTTRKGLRAFVNFYYELYKGNKFAVPFLRFDEMNTLSKRKILPSNSARRSISWL